MLRAWCLALAFASAAAACGGNGDCDTGRPGHVVFKDGAALTVRIADEPDERAQGLMGFESLPPDEGVAFLYGGRTEETFWMKDTLIPLSIAFVDGNRVVAVREMAPCAGDPCPTYDAGVAFTYAVEANRGWFAAHGIGAGDRVGSFDGPFCR